MIHPVLLPPPWAWAFAVAGCDVLTGPKAWDAGCYLALCGAATRLDDGLRRRMVQEVIAMRARCPDMPLPARGHRDLAMSGIVAVGRVIERVDAETPWASTGRFHHRLAVTVLPRAVPWRGRVSEPLEGEALLLVREGFKKASA